MPARPQGGVAPPKTHRRPIRANGYVWCEHHGSIHEATPDIYTEEAWMCSKPWWRPVYVLGERGEEF
jgi:hypothetical protein